MWSEDIFARARKLKSTFSAKRKLWFSFQIELEREKKDRAGFEPAVQELPCTPV